MKKILTIVGARPQFIKCSSVSKEIRKNFNEVIVHTGQHYDENMSGIFFKQLNIPIPEYNLGIKSALHGEQTGKMLIEIEKVLHIEKPDAVIVYGDTNSTLAGALAASKMLIPVFHIEAGLRSFNMEMPEEQNRVLTDKLSTLLFCPTDTSVKNLRNEGITDSVYQVGDVMYDSTIQNIIIAEQTSNIIEELCLKKKSYILATIHRAENTNDRTRIENIIGALNESDENIILPLHPRTQKCIFEYGIKICENIKIIEPVSYMDMLILEKNAKKIISDSGGVQKEAYFVKTPCIVIRDETEWVELLDIRANVLAGAKKQKIIECIKEFSGVNEYSKELIYGDGKSAVKINEIIKKYFELYIREKSR